MTRVRRMVYIEWRTYMYVRYSTNQRLRGYGVGERLLRLPCGTLAILLRHPKKGNRSAFIILVLLSLSGAKLKIT